MITKLSHLAVLSALALASLSAHAATVTVTAGTYTENFNSLAAGTEPTTGWTVRTGATSSSLGTALTTFSATARDWGNTGASFKHISSTNIASTSTAAEQLANTNRALGITQGASGNMDPGAAFTFNFSTTNVLLNSISIDLLLLKDNAKESVFEIQYAVGETPTSFTTLASWTSTHADGFGSSTFTFDRADFGTDLDGESQAWFRVVALTASTGTGTGRDMVGIDNFSITANAVPEPSAMLLGAIGALGLIRRRRR